MINLSILRWRNFPSGPNIITRLLVGEKQEGQIKREIVLLTLKIKDGVMPNGRILTN